MRNLFSGSAASLVAGTGTGPWRTHARLQQVKLAAADQVVLACGGVWNETLKITGSDVVAGASSATIPLVITAPTGRTSPPEINGAEALLAKRLDERASNGCIRISATLNHFIDRYRLIDADYEQVAQHGRLLWVLRGDRTPVATPGRYLVVVDTQRSALPTWARRP